MVIMSNAPHIVIVSVFFKELVGGPAGPAAPTALQLCLHFYLEVVCLDGGLNLRFVV